MHLLGAFSICFSVIIYSSVGTFTENDLQTKLFGTYNKDCMPRTNVSVGIQIKMDWNLLSIAEVDEKNQIFKIRGFLEMKWMDVFLTWNPYIYSGIRSIHVPNNKIWQPDLALLDTYDSLTDLGQLDGRAVVDFSGNVTIWPYKMYTVGCKIKVRHFPFDVQTCQLDFLSWTSPVSVLDIRTAGEDINRARYSENEVWRLEKTQTTYYRQTYGVDQWAHIKYTFTLRRKWLFCAINIIAPIMCISLLNVATFLLPAASGEKISLCISTFLALAVFLTMITGSLPESSDEPSILGWYVGLQLLGNGFTIILTVISLRFYTNDNADHMPAAVKFLCRLGCQTRQRKFMPRNQLAGSYKSCLKRQKSNDSNSDYVITGNETNISWVTASKAFDLLCLWVAVTWHVCLTIGLIAGYSK